MTEPANPLIEQSVSDHALIDQENRHPVMKPGFTVSRRRVRDEGQRGSALLIVFVMAAAIAIMLYLEMPVATFEARRQKEQLLIDRGNEYAHGVKLYLRKIGHYPPSIEAMENTNRIRFLRHRFKDPFTGEENWRLLHAGPNGMLIDSKVNPLQANGLNQNGKAGSPAGSSGANAGSSTNSLFGGQSTSSSTESTFAGFNNNIASSSSTGSDVVVPVVQQRAPAIAATGAAAAGSGTDVAGNPNAPLIQPSPEPAVNGINAQSAAPGLQGQGTSGQGLPGQGTQAQGLPGQGTQGAQPNEGAGTSIFPGTQQVGAIGSSGATSGIGGAAGQNGTGTGGLGSGSTSQRQGPGQLNSGGLAGVASIAKGHTIKSVNDQTDYSLWEFFYDPSKDTMRVPGAGVIGGGASGGAQSPTGQAGVNTQQNSGSTGFNFGGSNGSSTGAGSGLFNTPSGSTATQPTTPSSSPSIGAPTSSPQQQPQ